MNRIWPRPVLAAIAVLMLSLAACGGDDGLPFDLRTQDVAQSEHVSDIVFAPDGRIFLAEQHTGVIRVVSADGDVQDEPFATLDVFSYLVDLDWGLTSLALDPNFETNGYVYAFYSAPVSVAEPPTVRPTIARLTDENGVGTDLTVIVGDLPVTSREHLGFNANGKIRFGPDGFLYASIGDYDYEKDGPGGSAASQDLSNPLGSLLRIDAETGEAAPGNPYEDDPDADPRIFAHGFREPFPFEFHPQTGAIYGTDNTTVTCEQLNIIEAGNNYGWPDVGEFPYEDCDVGNHAKPIYFFAQEGMEPDQFLSFVEVTSLAFVPGDRYPEIGGDSLFTCERGTGVLRRVVLSPPDYEEVTADDVIADDCHIAVATAPDGTVYYASTTNVVRLTGGGGE